MAEAQEGKENDGLLCSLIRAVTPYLCVAGRNEPLGMDGRGGLVGIHRIYALPEGDSRLHPLSPETDESRGNSAGIACRRDACRCLPDEEGLGRRKAADVEGVRARHSRTTVARIRMGRRPRCLWAGAGRLFLGGQLHGNRGTGGGVTRICVQ